MPQCIVSPEHKRIHDFCHITITGFKLGCALGEGGGEERRGEARQLISGKELLFQFKDRRATWCALDSAKGNGAVTFLSLSVHV